MKTNNSSIIVAFHIGRGGRHYNAGHISYLGEHDIDWLITQNSDNLFDRNRDKHGRFCPLYWIDGGQRVILDSRDIVDKCGRLDFDGEYDTDYCKRIEDCTEEELALIVNSGEVMSYQLDDWLKENYRNE